MGEHPKVEQLFEFTISLLSELVYIINLRFTTHGNCKASVAQRQITTAFHCTRAECNFHKNIYPFAYPAQQSGRKRAPYIRTTTAVSSLRPAEPTNEIPLLPPH